MRKLSAIILAGAVFAVAGCQSSGTNTSYKRPASGVEGNWISADGVAASSFSNGIFTTTATDTGSKLAQGSYAYIDANSVTITVNSLIRQTTTKVTCTGAAQSRLNCTTESGNKFSLVRRVQS